MIKINLLPVREARRRADLQQQGILLGVLLAVAIGGVGYAHYAKGQELDRLRSRIAQTEKQIDRYGPQLEQVETFKKKKAEVQQKLEVIQGLERSRSGPVRILDELATKTPERLWLTQLRAEGGRLEIEGMSLDNEVIAAFLTSLEESPYFDEVELEQTELQGRGEIRLNRFRLSSHVVDPEEPKEEGEGTAARPPRVRTATPEGPALAPAGR